MSSFWQQHQQQQLKIKQEARNAAHIAHAKALEAQLKTYHDKIIWPVSISVSIERQREIRRKINKLDADLSILGDPSSSVFVLNKVCKEYEVHDEEHLAHRILFDGCKECNIEKIELAVKHGANIGRFFTSDEGIAVMQEEAPFDPEICSKRMFRFSYNDHDNASDTLMQDPKSERITNAVELGLGCLIRNYLKKPFDLNDEDEAQLARQCAFLDRFLDLMNNNSNSNPRLGNQYKTYGRFPFRFIIEELCTFRSDFPIRGDLIRIMLEKGRKCFAGDETSDTEFSKVVLWLLLRGGRSMMNFEDLLGTQYSLDFSPPASPHDDCSSLTLITHKQYASSKYCSLSFTEIDAFLGCLRICIDDGGLTPKDLNSPLEDATVDLFGAYDTETLPLLIALTRFRSADVANFLIDRGADPNLRGQHDSFDHHVPPLKAALGLGNTAVANCLILHGAKFESEPIPEWAKERVKAEEDSTGAINDSLNRHRRPRENNTSGVMRQVAFDHYCCIFGASDLLLDHESIRTLFGAMKKQNLSLCCTKDQFIYSPLSMMILRQAPLVAFQLMLKVYPKLMHIPRVVSSRPYRYLPFGCLIYHFVHQTEERPMTAEYANDLAKILLVHGNLNFFQSAASIRNARCDSAESVLISMMQDEEPAKRELRLRAKIFYDFCVEFEKRRGNLKIEVYVEDFFDGSLSRVVVPVSFRLE